MQNVSANRAAYNCALLVVAAMAAGLLLGQAAMLAGTYTVARALLFGLGLRTTYTALKAANVLLYYALSSRANTR